ncbi:hypothetical protein AVEN_22669-1 [Araneus ventricosus]|uniref:Uncharacterized protein n=1 Tax=Araneus ventricosus TaxID=182803 RepID=A0A4Y2H1F9_ARAVE|nr:hypothetical protein AVEN_22669-1 [Araneus ventricosus]
MADTIMKYTPVGVFCLRLSSIFKQYDVILSSKSKYIQENEVSILDRFRLSDWVQNLIPKYNCGIKTTYRISFIFLVGLLNHHVHTYSNRLAVIGQLLEGFSP